MISPFILFAVSLYWGIHSPMRVIDTHPRLFCWTMGIVFSNIAVCLQHSEKAYYQLKFIAKQKDLFRSISKTLFYFRFIWRLIRWHSRVRSSSTKCWHSTGLSLLWQFADFLAKQNCQRWRHFVQGSQLPIFTTLFVW